MAMAMAAADDNLSDCINKEPVKLMKYDTAQLPTMSSLPSMGNLPPLSEARLGPGDLKDLKSAMADLCPAPASCGSAVAEVMTEQLAIHIVAVMRQALAAHTLEITEQLGALRSELRGVLKLESTALRPLSRPPAAASTCASTACGRRSSVSAMDIADTVCGSEASEVESDAAAAAAAADAGFRASSMCLLAFSEMASSMEDARDKSEAEWPPPVTSPVAASPCKLPKAESERRPANRRLKLLVGKSERSERMEVESEPARFRSSRSAKLEDSPHSLRSFQSQGSVPHCSEDSPARLLGARPSSGSRLEKRPATVQEGGLHGLEGLLTQDLLVATRLCPSAEERLPAVRSDVAAGSEPLARKQQRSRVLPAEARSASEAQSEEPPERAAVLEVREQGAVPAAACAVLTLVPVVPSAGGSSLISTLGARSSEHSSHVSEEPTDLEISPSGGSSRGGGRAQAWSMPSSSSVMGCSLGQKARLVEDGLYSSSEPSQQSERTGSQNASSRPPATEETEHEDSSEEISASQGRPVRRQGRRHQNSGGTEELPCLWRRALDFSSGAQRVCGVLPWDDARPAASVLYQRSLFFLACAAASVALVVTGLRVSGSEAVSDCAWLFSDVVVAVGAMVCLAACGAVSGDVELSQCNRLLVSYAERQSFSMYWAKRLRWDVALVPCLYLLAVSERLRSVAIVPLLAGGDVGRWEMTNVVTFAFSSAVFLASVACVLRMSCCLASTVDAFCWHFVGKRNLQDAVQQWNVAQAIMRKTCRTVQGLFFVLQTTFILATLLCLADAGRRERGSVMDLVPISLILVATGRIFFSGASVTDRCRRVPALVNSLDFGKDIDEDKMYLVEHLVRSRAGFYVLEAPLDAAMAFRLFYFACVVAVLVLLKVTWNA